MQKKPKHLKVMAIITLLSFVCTEFVWAVPGGIAIAPSRETPAFLRIEIPKDLATIEEVYEAPPQLDPRMILHIQDLHGNFEAQTKIKNLLDYLHETYNFQLLFVEGASETLNPDLVRVFPDKEHNQRFVELLAKEGELSAPEMFVASGVKDLEAVGIEDVELYRKNYDAFKSVHRDRESIDAFLSRVAQHVERLSSRFLSKDLLRLLKEWRKFELGHRDFLPYVKRLSQEAKRFVGLDLESLFAQVEWPQTTRLLVLQSMEKDLNRDQAEREKQLLLEFLIEKRVSDSVIRGIEKLGDREITMTSLGTDESQLEKLPRYLLERLIEEAGPKGFFFHDYPQFSLLAGYLILQSELDSKNLFDEIEKIFEKVLNALAVEEREKNLLELHRDQDLLRKLLSLELTRKEWERANYRKEWIRPDVIVKRIYGINHDESTSNPQVSARASKDVMPAFKTALEFYGYARQRDEAFYTKIDQAMTEKNSEKAILVTGGFHTDGLMDIFREEHINYGVLMPKIGGSIDNGNYLKSMLEERNTMFDLATIADPVMLQSLLLGIAQGIENPLNEEKQFLQLFASVADAPTRELLVDIFNTFNSSAHSADRGVKLILGGNRDRIYIQVTGEYPEISDAQLMDDDGVWMGRSQDGEEGYITIPIVERKDQPAARRFGLESHIEIVMQGPSNPDVTNRSDNFNIPDSGASVGIAASETRTNIEGALEDLLGLAENGRENLVDVEDYLRGAFEPNFNDAIMSNQAIDEVLLRHGFGEEGMESAGFAVIKPEPARQLHSRLIQTSQYVTAQQVVAQEEDSFAEIFNRPMGGEAELARVYDQLFSNSSVDQVRRALDRDVDGIEELDEQILVDAGIVIRRLNQLMTNISVDTPRHGVTSAEIGRIGRAIAAEGKRRDQSDFKVLFDSLGAAVPKVVDRIVAKILSARDAGDRDQFGEYALRLAKASESKAEILDENGGVVSATEGTLVQNEVLDYILQSGVQPGRYADLSRSVQRELQSDRFNDVIDRGEYLGRPQTSSDSEENNWGENFPELSSLTVSNHTSIGRAINQEQGITLRDNRSSFRIPFDESKGGGEIKVYVSARRDNSNGFVSTEYVSFYYSPFYQRVYAIASPTLMFGKEAMSATASQVTSSPGSQIDATPVLMGSSQDREDAIKKARDKGLEYRGDDLDFKPFNRSTMGLGVSRAHLVAKYDPSLNQLYLQNVGSNGSWIVIEDGRANITFPFAKSETRTPELLASVNPSSIGGWAFVAILSATAFFVFREPKYPSKAKDQAKRLSQINAALKDSEFPISFREKNPVLLQLPLLQSNNLGDAIGIISDVAENHYPDYLKANRLEKNKKRIPKAVKEARAAYEQAQLTLITITEKLREQGVQHQKNAKIAQNLKIVADGIDRGPLFSAVVNPSLETIKSGTKTNTLVRDTALSYLQASSETRADQTLSNEEFQLKGMLDNTISSVLSRAVPSFPRNIQLAVKFSTVEGKRNIEVNLRVPKGLVEYGLYHVGLRVTYLESLSAQLGELDQLSGYDRQPVQKQEVGRRYEYSFSFLSKTVAKSETRSFKEAGIPIRDVRSLLLRVNGLVTRLGVDFFEIDLKGTNVITTPEPVVPFDENEESAVRRTPGDVVRAALSDALRKAKRGDLVSYLSTKGVFLKPTFLDEETGVLLRIENLPAELLARTALSSVRKSETRLTSGPATVQTEEEIINTGDINKDFARRFGVDFDPKRLEEAQARRRQSTINQQTNRGLLTKFSTADPQAQKRIDDLQAQTPKRPSRVIASDQRVQPEVAARVKLLSEQFEAATLRDHSEVADKVESLTMKVAAVFTRGLVSLAISPTAQAAVLEPFAILVTLDPRNEVLEAMESRAVQNFDISLRNNIVAGTLVVSSYLPTLEEVESDLRLLELQTGQHLAYVVGVNLEKVKETETQAAEYLRMAEERDLKDRFFIIVTFDDLRNVTKVTQRVANSTVHARMRRMNQMPIGQNMVTVFNGTFQTLATRGTIPGTPVTSDILRAEHLAARTFAAMRLSQQVVDSMQLDLKAAQLVNQDLDAKIILPRDTYFYVNNDVLGEVASMLVAIAVGEYIRTQA